MYKLMFCTFIIDN